jgi:Zn-dependent peptidase ImmA (M78 family)
MRGRLANGGGESVIMSELHTFLAEEARTQTLFRYIRALDQGDEDAITQVLEAALRDPELDRLLGEVNLAFCEEGGLSPVGAEVELVRHLLRRHFASAFEEPETDAPLMVADVAAKLHADWRGSAGVTRADRDTARQLLSVDLPVPATLSRSRLDELSQILSSCLSNPASARFWHKFKNAAISLRLRGTTPQGQLALARESRTQSRGVLTEAIARVSISQDRTHQSIDADYLRSVVRAVWDAAGLNPDEARGVVPVNDLLQPYNLAPTEVPGLTYETAVDHIRRETGRVLATRPNANQTLAGFLYAEANDGLLLVKKEDPIARRRFTVVHELGHFLLHRSDTALVLTEALFAHESVEAHDADDVSLPSGQIALEVADEKVATLLSPLKTGDLRRMEREANAFAAELLMPQALCESLFAAHQKQFGTSERVLLRRLSSALLVSPEAMRYRLEGLGLLAASNKRRLAP